jgi:hypothetical protein
MERAEAVNRASSRSDGGQRCRTSPPGTERMVAGEMAHASRLAKILHAQKNTSPHRNA